MQRNASSTQIFILMFICATGSCVSGDGVRSVLLFKVEENQTEDQTKTQNVHAYAHAHTNQANQNMFRVMHFVTLSAC